MVKHGRNKKRRAGRIGRTKLKNRNFRFFKPPQITDLVVKESWNPKRSAAENMAALGLSTNNTRSLSNSTTAELAAITSNKAVELYDIPDSDNIPKSTLRMLPVSIENQGYMVKLFAKYGSDYKKMSMDIKLNNMQHTEKQLQKIGARFLLLNENQLRSELPDSVKALMAFC